MKSLKLKNVAFIIVIVAGTLSFSCKKVLINEVKVPDFVTLSAQFKVPPAEYTTAPFFVWNAEITKPEIDSFLVSFKNAVGVKIKKGGNGNEEE